MTEQLHFLFSLSCIWRSKWQPSPVFLPGESQGQRSLVGCCVWSPTESETTEVTQEQQHCNCNSHDHGLRLGIFSSVTISYDLYMLKQQIYCFICLIQQILTEYIKYASIDLGIKQWTKLTIVIALLKFIIQQRKTGNIQVTLKIKYGATIQTQMPWRVQYMLAIIKFHTILHIYKIYFYVFSILTSLRNNFRFTGGCKVSSERTWVSFIQFPPMVRT